MKEKKISFQLLRYCLLILLGAMLLGAHAQPYLLKEINISNGGNGKRMLLGDVTGNGQMEMVMMQPNKMSDDRYIGHEVNCLTVFDMKGNQIWQVGNPSVGAGARSDIPAQIYDIDQDGKNEVLACMNGRVRVFDGKTGKEEYSFAYPHKDAHDCIIIANIRGTSKPQDIILKDRYKRVWAMDRFGKQLWTHRGNTGHYPWPYDFDGDGKDELMCGYDLLDDNGKKLWTAKQGGHADCIWVGNIDGNSGNGMEIAIGGDDVTIYNWRGSLLWRNNKPKEPQNIALGDFRPDLPGIEVAGQDRRNRGNPGEEAIFLIDGKGKMVTYNKRKGWYSILYNMKNWEGNNKDYIMIWRNAHNPPSLFNGRIQPVVSFPKKGYMMSADMNGDGRDEVIIFTEKRAYIYGSTKIDITKPVSGIPAPRPQLKKHYNFTRYWGGEYIKNGGSCSPSSITPYVQINGGSLKKTTNVIVNVGDNIMFSPKPVSGGTWAWSGPNGFNANTRKVTINNIQTNQAGNYVATFINSCGAQSKVTFNVTVKGGSTGTTIAIQENKTGFCKVDGSIDNNNSGFTGDGFSNTSNATGKGVDYKVTFSAGGTYTFTFRYANGSSNRPGNLIIDGSTAISSINFPSTNGWTTWKTISASTSVSAGTYNVRLQATSSGGLANIDYMKVTGSIPSAANCSGSDPINKPPTISITSPSNGATFSKGDNVTISVSASDSDGSISLVEFFQGSTKLGEDTGSPYSYTWNNVAVGNYSITARATDNKGKSTVSSPVSISVKSTGGEPVTLIIEENETGFCSVDGTIDNNHSGYSGKGFSNTHNANGKGITWSVNIPSSGSYNLKWKYANGSSANRTAQVKINGSTVVSSLGMPSTGAWNSWKTVSTIVSLPAGKVLVRLEATNSLGLSNIDYMAITGIAPSRVGCTGLKSATIIASNSNVSNIKVFPNPVKNNNIKIIGSLEMESNIQVYIYNGMGQLMASHNMGMLEKGRFENVIAIDKLSAGMYYMKFIMDSDIRTIPFIKE